MSFFILYLSNVCLIYWSLPFFFLYRQNAIPAVMPTPLHTDTLLLMVMVITESVDPSELKSNSNYINSTLFFLVQNEKKVHMLYSNDLLKFKINQIQKTRSLSHNWSDVLLRVDYQNLARHASWLLNMHNNHHGLFARSENTCCRCASLEEPII